MLYETNELWEVKVLKYTKFEYGPLDSWLEIRNCLCLVPPNSDSWTWILETSNNEKQIDDIWRNIDRSRKSYNFIKILDNYTYFSENEKVNVFPLFDDIVTEDLDTCSPTELSLNLSADDKKYLSKLLGNIQSSNYDTFMTFSSLSDKVQSTEYNYIFEMYPFLENYFHKMILGEDFTLKEEINKKFYNEEVKRKISDLEAQENSIKNQEENLKNRKLAIQKEKQKIIREAEQDL